MSVPAADTYAEAGPSSLRAPHHDPAIRRSKTINYPLHHSPPATTASAPSAGSAVHQLALPIQLNYAAAKSNDIAVGELRGPTLSPSRRGDTLRAYSRQRRVFSDRDNAPQASPDRFARNLPLPAPASPSLRLVQSMRNTDPTGVSALLFSSTNDDPDALLAAPRHSSYHLDAPLDETQSSMSSTPSLTSPTSTLSRSTSLRSARDERATFPAGTRYLSLNASSELPTIAAEGLSPEYGASNWTRRARRWSNSMSRRMSITALNHTLHSTTTPYLKAGLQELRSIFDVDTLGAALDDQHDDDDLEGASPIGHHARLASDHERLRLFRSSGTASSLAASRQQAVFESPEDLTPNLSRQSSSEDREHILQTSASRTAISFKSQIYEAPVTHRRAQSWRKHRSLSISDLPLRSELESSREKQPTGLVPNACPATSSGRDGAPRPQSIRAPLVAVGLAALSVSIVALCVLETSIHPDAASMPLTAFMLSQSAFALVGVAGLALQRRWLIDLASRLIRAHVLCQVLIAMAALRSLSRTAFYRDRFDRATSNATMSSGMLTSSHLLSTRLDADPHTSLVGSLGDQVTYLCVFLVQAALPLALVLWAQYSMATTLSRTTRQLPAHRTEPSMPIIKVADAVVVDVPHSHRMRYNSENPSNTKSSTQSIGTSEGWLGFVITRIDDSASKPQYELDPLELANRLQALAGVEK
ncbi:hypothetical protein PaG_00499 [Moesziomyces aphidis]|uniref:Uncharacterized protein n=1 Tax=Moesziomyces aphidis TaxID=84754 RepID=W3VW84_MOEAP|nr:hypothetical protein PaG_00499 [Moesziomyces aphidis]